MVLKPMAHDSLEPNWDTLFHPFYTVPPLCDKQWPQIKYDKQWPQIK